MKKLTILVGLSLVLSILLSIPVESELKAAQGSIDSGKTIFETKCSPCHTIGSGTRVGPDLKGVTDLRSRDWLVNFISNPEKMFQAGDSTAKSLLTKFGGIKMPDLGLSQQEISDVLTYIGPQQPPSGVSPPKGEIPTTIAGDPSKGEKLFIGAISFQNGGPPCISCHDASGIPFPGGGTLGPDLTGIYSKFGPSGINPVLATLPFPTMAPIFGKRLLILQEQLDLRVFFQKMAAAKPPVSMTLKLALFAVGGFIVLMILIWRIWRKRLLTVRKSLVEQAMGRGGARS
jgi:cytochrome c2